MSILQTKHLYHTLSHVDEATAELQPAVQQYLWALLKPDVQEALRVSTAYVQTTAQLEHWWEGVVRPSMYMIGELWARGKISVGQEHLATAITQRVMAFYYPMVLEQPRTRGPVVITASPGELHELGARIVADLFELHGWDAWYTGANTPAEDIIDLLERTGARFLGISTTQSTSLLRVAALIGQVRAALPVPPKIIVGGQAYLAAPNLWQKVGADWFAGDAREGLAYMESLEATE